MGFKPKLACACCPPRRDFLGKLAALGAAAALPRELLAQTKKKQDSAAARARRWRIDVHHHLIPPGYFEALGSRRQGAVVKWSPEMSIEEMDKNAIDISLISLVQPAVAFNDVELGRKLARQSNDYAAQIAR